MGIANNTVTLAATDSYRLSEKKIKLNDNKNTTENKIIIPVKKKIAVKEEVEEKTAVVKNRCFPDCVRAQQIYAYAKFRFINVACFSCQVYNT